MPEHEHTPLTPEELREVKREFELLMNRFLPKYRQYYKQNSLMAAIEGDTQFAEDGMVLITLGEKIGISDLGAYLQDKI